MKKVVFALLLVSLCLGCKNSGKEEDKSSKSASVEPNDSIARDSLNDSKKPDSIPVTPVQHAAFVMKLNEKTIYVDPIGAPADYEDLPSPDFVLITHDHPDHLKPKLLKELITNKTPLIGPKSVKNKLPDSLHPQTQVMANGDEKDLEGVAIKAVPMYNLREEAKKFHPEGKGNGYVLSFNEKRIYISGDTEDIPEMRDLENIDLAFVCMNLPYTMTVDQAVDAVLDFKPKKVYPYHYRGEDKFSDVEKFKKEVETKNPDIHVQLLNWYPDRDK